MKRRAVKKVSTKRSVAKKAPPKRKPIKRAVAKSKPAGPSPVPPGHHTVTPHLVMRNAAAAIEFYQKAFGAVEVMRMPGFEGKGIGHAEMTLGDSFIYVADEWPGADTSSPEKVGGTTVSIHLYVKDADALFSRAVAAGAKVAMPPMNMFWGDRFAKVIDPFGHCWSIATHVEDVLPAEMETRMVEAMKQMSQGQPPTA